MTLLPLSGASYPTSFTIAGEDLSRWKAPTTECLAIGPSYFATMSVPMLTGRPFSERDNQRSPKVAIINATLSRTFFANENPIGKKIIVWRESTDPREIVGMVSDVRNQGLDLPPGPDVYDEPGDALCHRSHRIDCRGASSDSRARPGCAH